MSRVKRNNSSDAPDILVDERPSLIFVHSIVDDMDLTPNAFRVYAHLARRSGKDMMAFPKYQSIGDHCFSKVYKHPDVRRRHAIAAVKELIEAGLIAKKGRVRGNGFQSSNCYRLLDPPPANGRIVTVESPLEVTVESLQEGSPVEGTPKEDAPLAGACALPSSLDEYAETGNERHTSLLAEHGRDQARAETEKAKATTREIKDAYMSIARELGDEPMSKPGNISYWAKRIAEKGFTPEQVKHAYREMKEDKDGSWGKFWEDGDIPLASVAKQLGAIVGAAQRKRSIQDGGDKWQMI